MKFEYDLFCVVDVQVSRCWGERETGLTTRPPSFSTACLSSSLSSPPFSPPSSPPSPLLTSPSPTPPLSSMTTPATTSCQRSLSPLPLLTWWDPVPVPFQLILIPHSPIPRSFKSWRGVWGTTFSLPLVSLHHNYIIINSDYITLHHNYINSLNLLFLSKC